MKNKSIYLMIILGIIIFIGVYSLIISRGRRMPSLELQISLQKSTYRLGSTIPVSVSLKNTGDINLLINSRMAVNFLGAPESLRDITFNITDPVGKTVPFTARVNTRSLTAKDIAILSPGELINKLYNLDELYDISSIGSYEISVTYQNTTTIDDYETVWKGEITSNTLTIEIIP